MNNNGAMTTGWQRISGQWYYMDRADVMQRGWFRGNDRWYFLLPNGTIATSTVIDGRRIGVDGIWIAAEGEVEPANITDLSTPCLMQNLLDGLSTRGYNIITSGRTSTGERWNNAIRLKGKESYVRYATNGQYRPLSGAMAPSSQFSSRIMAKVTIYGDNDIVLYTSQDVHHNEKLIHFGVGMAGQNAIRVEVSLVMDNEWDAPIALMSGLSLYKQAEEGYPRNGKNKHSEQIGKQTEDRTF